MFWIWLVLLWESKGMAPAYGKTRTRKSLAYNRPPSNSRRDENLLFSPGRNRQLEVQSENSTFFIESPKKPEWSPHFSPTKKRELKATVKRRLSFGEGLEQRLTKKVADSTSGWDLLDNVDILSKKDKPKRLLKHDPTVPMTTTGESKDFNDELELTKFLNRESQSTPGTRETQNSSLSSKDLITEIPSAHQSPVKRTNKTYGLRRSYLAEQDESEGHQYNCESDDGSAAVVPLASPTQNNLKSINQLRLHGQNLQRKDDFNFIIDGIENATSENSLVGSLLELAIALSDVELCPFLSGNITDRETKMLLKKMANATSVQSYLLSFIFCKLAESNSHFTLQGYAGVEKLLSCCITMNQSIDYKGLTKSNLSLLKQLQKKLGTSYTTRFFTLTIILQNGVLITKDLLTTITRLVSVSELIEKEYQAALILIEANLSLISDEVVLLNNALDTLLTKPFDTVASIILNLKALITISTSQDSFEIKDVNIVYKLLKSCQEHVQSEEMSSLYAGLLINLRDVNEKVKLKLLEDSELGILHEIYVTISKGSLPYLSILVGELVASGGRSRVLSVFDETELGDIRLQLQKFDSRGNVGIEEKIKEILVML